MDSTIIVAIISGCVSVVCIFLSAMVSKNATMAEMDKTIAVTQEKISELTREVREHNNFAKRMPVVEEQIKVINHRLSDLEQKAGN